MNASVSLRDRLNRTVRDIPRSGIRDFFDIVSTMKDVISLGIGEPDFDTPWHVRESTVFALERGATHYTSNLGYLELRKALKAEGLLTRDARAKERKKYGMAGARKRFQFSKR